MQPISVFMQNFKVSDITVFGSITLQQDKKIKNSKNVYGCVSHVLRRNTFIFSTFVFCVF